MKKFESFLDSFKGHGNDPLIESIKEGFQACFEMAGTYTQIYKESLDMFFKPEKGWKLKKLPGTYEYVADWELPEANYVVIRVMTSVNISTNASRKVGKDAIRIFALNTLNNKGWSESIKVNRTTNWQKNLIKAFTKVLEQAKKNYQRAMQRSMDKI